MKEIALSTGSKTCKGKNKGKYIALVDDSDYEYLNQYSWSISNCGGYKYARAFIENKKISMHRLIMGANGFNTVVDHIDHNTLNNQKENLRVCTRAQNQANTYSRPNTTSRYLGVCWYSRDKRWVAKLQSNYKKIVIGYFKDETEAAKAYDSKAKEIHGEFANLNFKESHG